MLRIYLRYTPTKVIYVIAQHYIPSLYFHNSIVIFIIKLKEKFSF